MNGEACPDAAVRAAPRARRFFRSFNVRLAAALLLGLAFTACASASSAPLPRLSPGTATPESLSAGAPSPSPDPAIADGQATPVTTASAGDAGQSRRSPVPQGPPPVYVGVWLPGVPEDMSKLAQFEQEERFHVGLVSWYQSWDDARLGPDLSLFQAVDQHGSVPFLTWESQDYRLWNNQPDFSLVQIASGRYDDYVRLWAQTLAAYGRPVMLRWGHEMNGDWYPWGYNVNGNTPAQFVAAWRHLHDIFVAAGASNVQWVWCPNVAPSSSAPLEAFYPGDAYVDWIGLDGTNRPMYGWRSFTQLFRDSYRRITAITAKPMLIGETASGELPGDTAGNRKAAWITSTLTSELPSAFPRVRAFIWFNESKVGVEKDGEDWSLATPAERAAFASAVAKPPYTEAAPPADLP